MDKDINIMQVFEQVRALEKARDFALDQVNFIEISEKFMENSVGIKRFG